MTTTPVWPDGDEPDRLTGVGGGFVDGAGRAHPAPPGMTAAFRRAGVWTWAECDPAAGRPDAEPALSASVVARDPATGLAVRVDFPSAREAAAWARAMLGDPDGRARARALVAKEGVAAETIFRGEAGGDAR